jgi:hypothetical protein
MCRFHALGHNRGCKTKLYDEGRVVRHVQKKPSPLMNGVIDPDPLLAPWGCNATVCRSRIESAGAYGLCQHCNMSFCLEHSSHHAESCMEVDKVSLHGLPTKSCDWHHPDRGRCGRPLGRQLTSACASHNQAFCPIHAKQHLALEHIVQAGISQDWLKDRLINVSESCTNNAQCSHSFSDPSQQVILCGACGEIRCPSHAWDTPHTCETIAAHAISAECETEPGFHCDSTTNAHAAEGTSMGCPNDGTLSCVIHMDTHLRNCVTCVNFHHKLPSCLPHTDPLASSFCLPCRPSDDLSGISALFDANWAPCCLYTCRARALSLEGERIVSCGSCRRLFCHTHADSPDHQCPDPTYHVASDESPGQRAPFTCSGSSVTLPHAARGISVACLPTDQLFCAVHAAHHLLACGLPQETESPPCPSPGPKFSASDVSTFLESAATLAPIPRTITGKDVNHKGWANLIESHHSPAQAAQSIEARSFSSQSPHRTPTAAKSAADPSSVDSWAMGSPRLAPRPLQCCDEELTQCSQCNSFFCPSHALPIHMITCFNDSEDPWAEERCFVSNCARIYNVARCIMCETQRTEPVTFACSDHMESHVERFHSYSRSVTGSYTSSAADDRHVEGNRDSQAASSKRSALLKPHSPPQPAASTAAKRPRREATSRSGRTVVSTDPAPALPAPQTAPSDSRRSRRSVAPLPAEGVPAPVIARVGSRPLMIGEARSGPQTTGGRGGRGRAGAVGAGPAPRPKPPLGPPLHPFLASQMSNFIVSKNVLPLGQGVRYRIPPSNKTLNYLDNPRSYADATGGSSGRQNVPSGGAPMETLHITP